MATIDDLAEISRLPGRNGPNTRHEKKPPLFLEERILDGCLIVAASEKKIIAAVGIDLDRCQLCDLTLSTEARNPDLLGSLIAAAERRAVGFGILRLSTEMPVECYEWLSALGYGNSPNFSADQSLFSRSLARRQTKFARQVLAITAELGIPSSYGRRHRMALQVEATRLVNIGLDVFGREQRLTPRAANAWQRMRQAADANCVNLQAVSAFRSASYQHGLVRRKLSRGEAIEDILKVSAAPGYSEHHTGRAIDVTTPGLVPLEEIFENSAAFEWMMRHAPGHGFRLSFPRNNRHGLAFEPWHWFYTG